MDRQDENGTVSSQIKQATKFFQPTFLDFQDEIVRGAHQTGDNWSTEDTRNKRTVRRLGSYHLASRLHALEMYVVHKDTT